MSRKKCIGTDNKLMYPLMYYVIHCTVYEIKHFTINQHLFSFIESSLKIVLPMSLMINFIVIRDCPQYKKGADQKIIHNDLFQTVLLDN